MIDAQDQEILLDQEKLKAEKEAHEKAYADRQKYLDDLRNGVLNTPAGRRICWDFLGMCGYQRQLFSSDPLVMAANCGTHDNILLVLMKDLEEAQTGILFRMQNEFRSAQANKDK